MISNGRECKDGENAKELRLRAIMFPVGLGRENHVLPRYRDSGEGRRKPEDDIDIVLPCRKVDSRSVSDVEMRLED